MLHSGYARTRWLTSLSTTRARGTASKHQGKLKQRSTLQPTQQPFQTPQPQISQAEASSPKHVRDTKYMDRMSFYIRCTGIVVGMYLAGHLFTSYFYEASGAYGISMLPTIASHGDILIQSKWYRRGRGIEVGDLVSYKHPIKGDTLAVKRVLGMPGDFVLRDTPGRGQGIMIQIPQGHCWVVGDDLPHSRDSRIFGPLPLALVTGKIIGSLEWKYGIIPGLRRFKEAFVPVTD